jgi:putative adenylate-forming enzyme
MFRQLDIAFHFVSARYRWATLHGEALVAYQERRLHRILVYVRERSPFYRAHWQGHDLADWRSLPQVDKRLMMENFSTFNTCGVTLDAAMQVALQAEESRDFRPLLPGPDHLTVGLSSGTSGHRGLFLVSPQEQAAWAGVILARTLHDISWHAVQGARHGGLRVAFFLRSNSNLYQQTHSALVQFRYFDLMQPLAISIAALNAYQPEILIGPPLLLGLLAVEMSAGRLHIHPKRLISVAEVLEPQESQRLESIFQVRVEQIYQCTEGLIAITCPAGSLHLQEDLLAVQLEPLEEDSPGAAQSLACTPIITDLWRKTQPMIRYRLNDILVLSPKTCSCGSDFKVLERIEGRCDDICYFPQAHEPAGRLRPFFPDTLRRMVLLAHADIADYLVIQDAPGSLRIRLEIKPAEETVQSEHFAQVESAVRQQVERTVQSYACDLERYPDGTCKIEILPGVPAPAPGAKRRRVQAQKFSTPLYE